MNLQPTLNRVLIKPDTELSPKKIIIPEAVKKYANQGEVIAVGPGRRHIDGKIYGSSLKPGDQVMYNPQHAMPFEADGEKYMVCEDENVLLILEKTGGIMA